MSSSTAWSRAAPRPRPSATLASSVDDANVAEGRGLRAARLQAVLDDICRHYLDSNVSAASVAQRVGITPRYVHQLLEDTGKTFSDHACSITA